MLDSHVCEELGELPDPGVTDVKKRRGRPPIKTFADSLPVVVTGHESSETLLNQAKKAGEEETKLSAKSLIPTTAAMLEEYPEEDNCTPTLLKRGRGRPKGSKKANNSQGKGSSFPCWYCKKTFSSSEECLAHELSHADTLYKCPHEGCGKTFNSKFKFQRHAIVHEKPNHLRYVFSDAETFKFLSALLLCFYQLKKCAENFCRLVIHLNE